MSFIRDSRPGDVFCFDSTEEQFAFFNGTIEIHGIEMLGNFTDPKDLNSLRLQAPVMQERYTGLGRKCVERPEGKYLRYVGTAATVRDLVSLADTLDGQGSPVNFIGLSYGSIIGSWLVNMFPEVLFGSTLSLDWPLTFWNFFLTESGACRSRWCS